MAGIAKQIIGSFEQIGKDVASETAKVPTEVAGKALESLGATGTKKGQQGTQAAAVAAKPAEGALGEMEQTKDKQIKKSLARAGLEQFAKPKQKEFSVHERQAQDEQKKKEMQARRGAAEKQFELKPMSSKQRRGMLYGKGGKKAATETKTAFRQD